MGTKHISVIYGLILLVTCTILQNRKAHHNPLLCMRATESAALLMLEGITKLQKNKLESYGTFQMNTAPESF